MSEFHTPAVDTEMTDAEAAAVLLSIRGSAAAEPDIEMTDLEAATVLLSIHGSETAEPDNITTEEAEPVPEWYVPYPRTLTLQQVFNTFVELGVKTPPGFGFIRPENSAVIVHWMKTQPAEAEMESVEDRFGSPADFDVWDYNEYEESAAVDVNVDIVVTQWAAMARDMVPATATGEVDGNSDDKLYPPVSSLGDTDEADQ